MTKRYNILNSNIIEDAFYIKDNKRKYSFPTTKDVSTLIMYEKVLNEQENLIERLKQIREEQIESILKLKRKIKELEKEKEFWKGSACHDLNLKSMLSFEIGKLTETKDIDAFLNFYYEYFCKNDEDVK